MSANQKKGSKKAHLLLKGPDGEFVQVEGGLTAIPKNLEVTLVDGKLVVTKKDEDKE